MRPFNTLFELIVINRPSSSKLELGLLLLVFDLDLSFFGVCLRCAGERFRFALRSSLSVLFNDAALPLLIRLGGRSLLRRARSRRPVCLHQIIVKIPAKSLHANNNQTLTETFSGCLLWLFLHALSGRGRSIRLSSRLFRLLLAWTCLRRLCVSQGLGFALLTFGGRAAPLISSCRCCTSRCSVTGTPAPIPSNFGGDFRRRVRKVGLQFELCKGR